MSEQSQIPPGKSILKNWLTKYWLPLFLSLYGIWVWSPFLAPVLMRVGWERVANLVYWIYSFFCHQLPDRSYFLFGENMSYSLSTIQQVWMDTANPMHLRKFIGNPAMGWKIAWSDRMISFYGGVWVFAMVLYPFRRRIKNLPLWGLGLFLVPMIIDGGSHFVSELTGYQEGFRFTNLWLSFLTKNRLPDSFYVGNMLGTFNSWMRIITGALAGLGIAWFIMSAFKSILPEYNQN